MVWVDYSKLRRELDIVKVMSDLGIELHGSGDQRKGVCPFDECRDSESRSLSVQVRKGLFKCWSCTAAGNVIAFAARVQGLDPDANAQFRKAAIALQEKYGITASKGDDKKPSQGKGDRDNEKTDPPKRERRRPTSEGGKARKDELVNEPLDFELKEIDPDHESVTSLALSPETVEYFGLGYCHRRGMFHDCIVLPIHNPQGDLVAYAGRPVAANDPGESPGDATGMKFPDRERVRKKDGMKLIFDRTRIVFNAHRTSGTHDNLIVVQDIRHAVMIHDMGYPDVVSILGDVCDTQISTLIDLIALNGTAWFLTDAGWPLKTMTQVARQRAVRWLCSNGYDSIKEHLKQIG